MGQNVSGKIDNRAAGFQRVYTTFTAAIDLTEEVPQAKCATSGLFVMNATAGALSFVWKDCGGTTNTLSVPANTSLDLPFAATTIEAATADTLSAVVAYWHPNAAGTR